MENKTIEAKNGDLRVWWQSNRKDYHFYVNSKEDAMIAIGTLSIREVDDVSIDYNLYSLEVYEDGEWYDWYNDDGVDINCIMSNSSSIYEKLNGRIRYDK